MDDGLFIATKCGNASTHSIDLIGRMCGMMQVALGLINFPGMDQCPRIQHAEFAISLNKAFREVCDPMTQREKFPACNFAPSPMADQVCGKRALGMQGVRDGPIHVVGSLIPQSSTVMEFIALLRKPGEKILPKIKVTKGCNVTLQ